MTRAGAGFGASGVRMEWVHGRGSIAPQGEGVSPGKIHRLIGPAAQWQRDRSAFERVRYSGIYRGVDLVFYGRGNGRASKLEHDFVLAPGADPSQIEIAWRGSSGIRVDDNGRLMVASASGRMEWSKPAAYQVIQGRRVEVDAAFHLTPAKHVRFAIGAYDPRFELVIDPVLAFSTYLGGSRNEMSRGVAADASGNVYVAGYTNSMNLSVTTGAYQTGFAGSSASPLSGDAFVAKYSPSGTLIYLTYLGGRRDDLAMAVAVDSAGSAYVAGYTNSTDFPVTASAYQKTFAGFTGASSLFPLGDGFVTKLSPDGKSLVYSTYFGGSSDDAILAIAVDASGNCYVTGTERSNNFPVSAGAFQTQYAGSGGQVDFPAWGYAMLGGDAFVAKLNPSGSGLIYSTLLGGSRDDVATSIAIDGSGNAYLGGYTLSTNFPTSSGARQTSFQGYDSINNFFFNLGDGFLAKVNPTGTGLVYGTYLGGHGDDWVSGIAVDSGGNLFATGSTTSRDFPVSSSAFQNFFQGPSFLPFLVDQLIGDAFLVRLNPTGTQLVFGTYVGGSGDEMAMGLTTDGSGNAILTGFTNSTNFPVTADAIQKTSKGPGPAETDTTFGDVFVSQFSPTGTELYSTLLGGQGNDVALSIAASPTGTVYVTGLTISNDFPTAQAVQTAFGGPTGLSGAGDAFVSAISGFSAAGNGPAITSVVNTTGGAATIAQNTWIEIKGRGLAPKTRIWTGADFSNNQLPVQLDGVSAKVNGKPAFVYYISDTQVNVLTPIDASAPNGPVNVELTNAGVTSAPFSVQMQTIAPGLFQFGGSAYVAAIHADGRYLGPASLYPGSTTPAKPDEVVQIYANGFGQTTPAIVNGSAIAAGALPALPQIRIGGFVATVQYAGQISPGLYQFNVVIPSGVPDGDASIVATYNNVSTQSGALITIQR